MVVMMAMNKKEQAAFNEMQTEIKRLTDLLQAAVKSEPVERDLKKPTGNEVTQGWDFNKSRDYGNVFQAWSTSIKNGYGNCDAYQYSRGYQNGIELFSTKLLALKAWRYEVEQDSLAKIANIDAQIAIEEIFANGNR